MRLLIAMSMPRESAWERGGRGEIGADRFFLRRQSTSVYVDTRPPQLSSIVP